MLHCIEQTAVTGGENIFCDGIKVAQDLKRVDPEAFRLLTTYPFEYFDMGKDYYGDFYQNARHPTIRYVPSFISIRLYYYDNTGI